MEVAHGYHSIEVPEAGLKIDMPRELAYCDTRQYREMADLIFRYQSGEIGLLEFRYLAVYRLLNLKRAKKKPGKDVTSYDSNIYFISRYLDSFFDTVDVGTSSDPEKKEYHIRQGFIQNHLPKVKILGRTLYGPDDYMSDITFGQYVDGLNHIGNYVKDPHPDHLLNLYATFYQNKSDKKNSRYNKKELSHRVKLSRKAYWGDIYGFFLFFASFQNYLTTAIVTWEGRDLDLSIIYEAPKEKFKSRIPGLGMKSMTYILAETSVFGKLEEVEQTNAWEVILRIYDIKKRDLDDIARSETTKK